MRKLVKNSEGVIFEMAVAQEGFIPDGHELVLDEDLEAAEAAIASRKVDEARLAKLSEIRALREPKLKRVDVLSNIAYLNSWTAGEKTELKNYRLALLDITEAYKADPSLLDDLDVAAIVWPDEPSES